MAGGVFLAWLVAFAQTPTLTFEVASVKQSPPSGHARMGLFPGGRFVANYTTSYLLIQTAYGVAPHELSHGPQWIYDDRFDFNCSAGRSVSHDEVKLMLQALLAERFKLKIHRETREATVYALVSTKTGPKFQAVGTDPSAKRGFPSVRLSRCSVRITPAKTTMKEFADWLSVTLAAPVSDETGLDGSYSFSLDYEIPNSRPEDDPAAIQAPSIFTAVQEQLGLKLESRKRTMEVVVIDHIERPTEN
jgi:uncharacterized protein (TIGR03435 family)